MTVRGVGLASFIEPLIRIQHRISVDTSTPSVILGLVPRICWPRLREVVQGRKLCPSGILGRSSGQARG